ncbi:polycystin-2-like protein 2 isoform X5 [Phascolarctos cinereus]
MAKVKSSKAKQQHFKATVSPKPKPTYNKELEIRSTFQELLIYIIFLIDLCILTFGMVSSNMYYLNKVIATLFLETSVPGEDRTNFKSISTVTEFWKFMEGPLLEGLYSDSWYNAEVLYQLKNTSRIYYENVLLGVPRVRQLKVRNNSCIVYPKFQSLMDECFDRYTVKNEDRSDFGPRQVPEWRYSPSTSSLKHWGVFGVYDNGGYMFTLPESKTEAKKKITFLKLNSWITRGTRVIFIDFSLYNTNVNLFCIIRLVAEFPAIGGVLTSWNFYSVKLLRYVTHFDYFIASCEIIFCIFIINFIVQEIKKMKEYKYAYFKSFWNLLELLLLSLSILAISVNIFRTSQAYHLLGQLLEKTQEYPDFYFLACWQIRYNDMVAVNIFFAWIKIFKFISFNKTMSQLSTTLSHCIKDIIGFAIMFFIIFFAYAQLGYFVFGSQVDDFSTFENSIFTQFRIVLGDFNFANIEEANWVLGPTYFITFIFFVFFVLLNMFLAIINDAYSEVKTDYSIGRRPESELANQIKTEIESASQMKKWKERLEQKYYSSETPDAYRPVTQQEFRDRAREGIAPCQHKIKQSNEKDFCYKNMTDVQAKVRSYYAITSAFFYTTLSFLLHSHL